MREIERLQYITPSTGDIAAGVEKFLSGGGRWVQLRMKGASSQTMVEMGHKLRELTNAVGAVLLINDDIHVAKTVAADGVHLGKSDVATQVARELLGDNAIIGRTANTIDDVRLLSSEPINYIGLGPYRFTTTKEILSPIIGLEGYTNIAAQMAAEGIAMPVVGVGGIEGDDIAPIMETGIFGVAVSGVIAKAQDIAANTSELLNIIERGKK